MQTKHPSPRKYCSRALALAWITDTLLGAAIGTLYFGDALAGVAWHARLFAVLALLSTAGMLLLIPIVPLFAVTLVRPSRRALGIAHAVLATAALLVLLADTQIWGLFRYHLNGMVWNVITTPGGSETYVIGAGTWAIVAAVGAAILAVELILWFRLFAPAEAPAPHRSAALTRAWRSGVALLLAIIVVEKGMCAMADVRGDREVSAMERLFPLYQRVTSKRLLSRVLDVDVVMREQLNLAGPKLLVRYPREAPRIDPRGPRPNILIVVVDSLRADALTAELMPNAWRWSRQRARTFTNHASGGSTTRFGIFSLVYGVHGTYWPAFYAERTPPVLVTELARLSYDMRVISSPRMTFPEFRSTAWVTIPDRVKDAWDGAHSWQRDLSARDDFAAWLDERAGRGAREPFFGFMLLDAPHQTYDWPREQSPYQPYLDKLDYMKMASRPPQDLIDAAHNSWRNAVHFDDGVFGRILHELARHGLESSTLVVLTGDHGEEFFEHGFFGHTSNYTRTQVEVTFAMAGPGVPPGIETRPTSHVDLPVTILELLGADPSGRADWAQGENLLAPLEHRDRIVAGWQDVGVWVDEGVLYVPLEGHKGSVNALDWDWKPHPDAAAVEKRHAGAVRELALASRRFVR